MGDTAIIRAIDLKVPHAAMAAIEQTYREHPRRMSFPVTLGDDAGQSVRNMFCTFLSMDGVDDGEGLVFSSDLLDGEEIKFSSCEERFLMSLIAPFVEGITEGGPHIVVEGSDGSFTRSSVRDGVLISEVAERVLVFAETGFRLVL